MDNIRARRMDQSGDRFASTGRGNIVDGALMSMCETAARFTCTIWEGPLVVPSVTVVTRDIVSFYIC